MTDQAHETAAGPSAGIPLRFVILAHQDGLSELPRPTDYATGPSDMSADDPQIIETWAGPAESVIEAGVVSPENTILSIQRRLHNDYNFSYKDVADIAIILLARNRDGLYAFRYPGSFRHVPSFRQTVAGIGIETNAPNDSEIVGVNFIVLKSPPNTRRIGHLMDQYLNDETRDHERRQIMSSSVSRHFQSPIQIPLQRPPSYRTGATSSGASSSSRTSSAQPLPLFDTDDRAAMLSRLEQGLSQSDALPTYQFPYLMELPEDMDPGVDVEVTYMVGPSGRPVPISATPVSSRNSDITFPLVNNFLNLLRHVNDMSDAQIVNIESLMEPVRVTVNSNGLDEFLHTYTHKDDDPNLRVRDQTACSICQTDYEQDSSVSYLRTCHHLFHTECIRKWLGEYNHKCPVCRLSADPQKK